jgi:hypothetical protein
MALAMDEVLDLDVALVHPPRDDIEYGIAVPAFPRATATASS